MTSESLFVNQNNASKLLLAIMESCHDGENAEKILDKMRPNELVSEITKVNPGVLPEFTLLRHRHFCVFVTVSTSQCFVF